MQKKYLKKEKKTGTTRIGKKKKYIYTSQVLVSIYAVHMYIDMAEFVWVITATQSGEIGGGSPIELYSSPMEIFGVVKGLCVV